MVAVLAIISRFRGSTHNTLPGIPRVKGWMFWAVGCPVEEDLYPSWQLNTVGNQSSKLCHELWGKNGISARPRIQVTSFES